ncbi:MAG TPA: sigma-54 dependent transcriptional regulator [Acidobacteriota bacterium]|nr:sigma-54 dependent transcriptional regulator [Acidobacteriota bacterium]
MSGRILLVEDRDSLREMFRKALEENGFAVEEARDGIEAVHKIKHERFLLILSDLRIPHLEGLEVLRVAKEADPDNVVILMTAYGSIEIAVDAMKNGAYDFLPKPVDIHHLLLLVRRVQLAQQLRYENILLKEEFSRKLGFPKIIGEAQVFRDVILAVQKAAPTDATVLITGESGTGKELFARAIHQLSPRKDAPFVAVNCAAIPEQLLENELFGHERGAFTGANARKLGKFEMAAGGSVFLDEIGEMTPPLQAKLLRVLQEKEFDRVGGTSPVQVDLRIIAATNRSLEQLVAAREFREDLFFRLSVFPIHIPPLRQRKKDIPLLAERFVEESSRELRRGKVRLSEAAIQKLTDYSWPGNVRELQNCLERAVILCDGPVITDREILTHQAPFAGSIGDYLNLDGPLTDVRKRAADEAERLSVLRAWQDAGRNVEKAAESLGITSKTLAIKLKDLKAE